MPVFALTFSDADWESALTALVPEGNCDERLYLKADLAFTNPATGAEETWTDVGVRYRGHSALDTPNHSTGNRWGFKLDFDAFNPGREFHGQERLNLLGTEGDPTLLRERLAYEVMHDAGVPAPFANHAWLVVNGEPLGLFPLVEEPDDRAYLEGHMPDPEGHLYKVAGYCHGTDLGYAGDSVAAYAGFEAKAGTADADKAADLVPMLGCLVGTNDDTVRDCLGGAIDVDEWLGEIAADTYNRNVDGMASTGQNFLLYAPLAGPMVAYPYDADLSWYGNDTNLTAAGIFDLRPYWETSAPVLPSVIRTVWKDEYCAALLDVAAREGDALTDRIRVLEDEYHDAVDEDPFLSSSGWRHSVDDLVEEAERQHARVVREATDCEIPPPPEDPPEDTAATP
jgi:hypothetical protein